MQATPDLQVTSLHRSEHLDQVVALQQRVWGYNDVEVDGRAALTVASRFAGQVLGAFLEGSMVGFSLAYATLDRGRFHSHRVGVAPEFQNRGVGRALKTAQREHALRSGFQELQWTFDPLQSRNAYFNLCKLGGVSKTYIDNLYGITSSPLHAGLPTDRLLIEWDLQSERVRAALAGAPLATGADSRRIAIAPEDQRRTPEVQQQLRTQFLDAFAAGYVLTGFAAAAEEEFYVLEKL